MMKTRSPLFRSSALPLLAVFLLGGAIACDGAPKKGARGESAQDARAPRRVEMVKAEAGHLPRSIEVTGALAADERAEVGFRVAGRIARIVVDLGTPVAQGRTLATLAADDYESRVRQSEAALAQARVRLGLAPEGGDGGDEGSVDPESTAPVRQARAQLAEARATRDRVRNLFEQSLVPRSELDRAEAAFGVADANTQAAFEEARGRQALLSQRRAELEIARRQLSDATLVAPFSGVVAERRGAIGDYVSAGDPVVVLVRIHPLRLRLAVPESEAASIHAGQPVDVDVLGHGTVRGRIARVSPALGELNHTLEVEAEVPNPQGTLKPGAFARARIEIQADAPAVLVPTTAIVTFAGIDKVLGIEDGKAKEIRVRLGRKSGERVEVVEGLAAGDAIVAAPGNLSEGQPVEAER